MRICDAASSPHNSGACRTIVDNLCTKGVVAFLLHSPVNAVCVCLSFFEEELLSPVEGRSGELIHVSV